MARTRKDVPAEPRALLSAWVFQGGKPGGYFRGRMSEGIVNFCRMDARVIAPLPHIFASFFARLPYKRKAGYYPNWNTV